MSHIETMGRPQFESLFNVHKNVNGSMDSITGKATFYDYMKEAREKRVDHYLASGNPNLRNVADLSEKELKRLADQFNPEDMTQEEYASFIDQLVVSGVLDDRDKNNVGYSNMVCLGTLDNLHLSHGGYVTPCGETKLTSLADANGDAYAWAKNRAQWEPAVDLVTGRYNYAVERSAEAFKKIESILVEMVSLQNEQG